MTVRGSWSRLDRTRVYSAGRHIEEARDARIDRYHMQQSSSIPCVLQNGRLRTLYFNVSPSNLDVGPRAREHNIVSKLQKIVGYAGH